MRGQAIVEFAFVLPVFLLIVLATVDFGRVIFMTSQLHNAVREGARYAKLHCADPGYSEADVKAEVVDAAPSLGLSAADVTVSSSGGCQPSTIATASTITVGASFPFAAVSQGFLGIAPFTVAAEATVTVE